MMMAPLGPYPCFCQREFQFRYELVFHLVDGHSIPEKEVAESLGYSLRSIGPLLSKARKMYPCGIPYYPNPEEVNRCYRSPGHHGLHESSLMGDIYTPAGVDRTVRWK